MFAHTKESMAIKDRDDALADVKHRLSVHVAKRVFTERVKQNLTIKQFADKAGYNPQFLDEVESGRVPISTELAENLAKALGKPYGWIVGEAYYNDTPSSHMNWEDDLATKSGHNVWVRGHTNTPDGEYKISYTCAPKEEEEEDGEMPYDGSHYEDAMEALVALLAEVTDENVGATLQLGKAIQALYRAQAAIEAEED